MGLGFWEFIVYLSLPVSQIILSRLVFDIGRFFLLKYLMMCNMTPSSSRVYLSNEKDFGQ